MTKLQAVDSTSETELFVDYLYDGLEGYVYCATKDPTGNFQQYFYEWPAQRSDLLTFISEHGDQHDTYVAPAVFKEPDAHRKHFKATNVVWAEFDGEVPTELSGTPKPTLRVISSFAGHEHWYWRLSAPETSADTVEHINRSITYFLGADASGWDCNQVLRPPSTTNHKNGQRVHIIRKSDLSVGLDDFSELPPPPEIQPEITLDVIPDALDVLLKYSWPDEAVKLFRTTSIEQGGRSSALMKLGYFCAEMGMSDVEIFAVIRNADDRWGKFKDRTDRNKRLTDLITRVRIKYPSLISNDEDFIPVFGLRSLLDSEIEIEWVIPGLLQEQGYMLLTGVSGVGKTQVSLRIALALALGRNWLGFEIDRPHRVLVMSLEMGHADIKYFLETMTQDMSEEDLDLLEQNLIIVPYGEAIYMDTEAGKQQLETIIKTVEPEGVFFDSVGSTTAGRISEEGPVKALMDYNDHLRKKYGVFTWYIHHMRKAQGDNKKPKNLADVYGNQYLVNRATSVYCLWQDKGKSRIEVIPLKKRLSKLEPVWEITRLVNLDFIRNDDVQIVEEPAEPVTIEYKAPMTPNKNLMDGM